MPVMPWKAAILFVLAATYTPGPNNLMAMDGARRFGLRRCLPFLAGMSSGLIFVIALSGLFNLPHSCSSWSPSPRASWPSAPRFCGGFSEACFSAVSPATQGRSTF